MAFCQNCGHKLDSTAKFCPECGEPVAKKDMSVRHQKFAGEIIKCPNCGEVLNAFVSRCPACGYELRGSDLSDSVKEFVQELKDIEAERKNDHHIDQLLANRIANYAVPNTKEDIFEFMILAASNIDPMAHNTDDGYSPSEREGKLMISNAWGSKYNQVYQKAKMMFPEEPQLVEIENLYKSKQKQIKKEEAKKEESKRKILSWFVAISIMIMLIVMIVVFSSREANLDKKLNATLVEIQEDISNGDYDNALIKANGLRYDKSLDSDKAEQWEEQREYLMNLINEKKGEN